MYRAIVCSDSEISPSPAFFTEKACFGYWYSRMKQDPMRIKGFMCYPTGEDDVNFYNMRACLIEDIMKGMQYLGVRQTAGMESEVVNGLLDLEIVELEEKLEYVQQEMKRASGYGY